jgi:hypothetical protein
MKALTDELYRRYRTRGFSRAKARKLAAKAPHVFNRPITTRHVAVHDEKWVRRTISWSAIQKGLLGKRLFGG